MKCGDKVTYVSHNKKEKGIVKSFSDDDYVFVVYHCDNNWEDYKNYTAARTRICDLILGWNE
jgi:transcriptional antiterminator